MPNLTEIILAQRKRIQHLRFKIRILEQEREAFGDVNRWYFFQENGRNGTEEELIRWYIEHQGATNYANEHPIDPTQDFCGEGEQ